MRRMQTSINQREKKQSSEAATVTVAAVDRLVCRACDVHINTSDNTQRLRHATQIVCFSNEYVNGSLALIILQKNYTERVK